MPGIICHWLFGQKMLPELKARDDLSAMDENCFLWGCQGPDVLFYSRLMPWMFGRNYRGYASPLHDEKAMGLLGVLAEMLPSYAMDDRQRMLGYCMGMCCHYSLDRVAHPFIYWLEEQLRDSDPRGKEYRYHGEIETMLNVMMLRRERGLLPCDIDLRECLPDDRSAYELIANIYANVLNRTLSVKTDMRTLRLLAPDMRESFRYLNDPSFFRRPAVAAAERLFGGKGWITAFMHPLTEDLNYDYANFLHSEWFAPKRPEIRGSEDFVELYEKSAADAAYITDCFIRASEGDGTLEKYTEGITFSGWPHEDA